MTFVLAVGHDVVPRALRDLPRRRPGLTRILLLAVRQNPGREPLKSPFHVSRGGSIVEHSALLREPFSRFSRRRLTRLAGLVPQKEQRQVLAAVILLGGSGRPQISDGCAKAQGNPVSQFSADQDVFVIDGAGGDHLSIRHRVAGAFQGDPLEIGIVALLVNRIDILERSRSRICLESLCLREWVVLGGSARQIGQASLVPGRAAAKLFKNMDELEIGDRFTVGIGGSLKHPKTKPGVEVPESPQLLQRTYLTLVIGGRQFPKKNLGSGDGLPDERPERFVVVEDIPGKPARLLYVRAHLEGQKVETRRIDAQVPAAAEEEELLPLPRYIGGVLHLVGARAPERRC